MYTLKNKNYTYWIVYGFFSEELDFLSLLKYQKYATVIITTKRPISKALINGSSETTVDSIFTPSEFSILKIW